MRAVNRASPLKRRRRTKAQVVQLERQIHDVLREDQPQSIRHVFYRMTDPRLPEPVEKSERGYRHVQERCTVMRREGRLPYGWISDATRRGHHVATYDDAGDFLRSVAGMYRADLWAQADTYCEVWTESRSIAGVIQNDCKELAVSLYPAGGFSSLTLAYQASTHINHYAADRGAVIFFIGDYDPAGVLIDVAIERELRSHLDPGLDLTFKRVGINPDQIEEYDLPTKPRKASDKRVSDLRETVEAEAMPAALLRRLLRSEIEALLPPRALEIARVAEESERSILAEFAEMRGDW